MIRYLKMLYVQVLIGISAGITVGYFFPEFSPTAKLLSDTFINMIKMVIAPIIFVTMVLGISGMGDFKKVGRVGGKGLLYFELVTTLALAIGLIVANLVQPGRGVQSGGVGTACVAQYPAKAKELNRREVFLHSGPPNALKVLTAGDIL